MAEVAATQRVGLVLAAREGGAEAGVDRGVLHVVRRQGGRRLCMGRAVAALAKKKVPHAPPGVDVVAAEAGCPNGLIDGRMAGKGGGDPLGRSVAGGEGGCLPGWVSWPAATRWFRLPWQSTHHMAVLPLWRRGSSSRCCPGGSHNSCWQCGG